MLSLSVAKGMGEENLTGAAVQASSTMRKFKYFLPGDLQRNRQPQAKLAKFSTLAELDAAARSLNAAKQIGQLRIVIQDQEGDWVDLSEQQDVLLDDVQPVLELRSGMPQLAETTHQSQ